MKIFLPISLVFLLSFLNASHANEPVKLTNERHGNGVRLYLENSRAFPATVSVRLELTNARPDRDLKPIVVPPWSKVLVCDVRIVDKSKKWTYKNFYYYRWGDKYARHDDRVIYDLPFGPGQKVRVSQGYHGAFSHKGLFAYALDFIVPVGTPIYAARDGVVVSTQSSFSEGGRDKKFIGKDNYVIIMHDDKTLSTYQHLKIYGVLVRAGQRVSKGTKIGLSGNTGRSTEPHLHFQVERPYTGKESETIPVKFNSKNYSNFVPKQGREYVAK